MSAALITASILSLVGLLVSFALGYMVAGPDDVLAHASLAIFTTLITLLGHSMTMFYLIGKVKAIKDAVIEGELKTDAVARASALRGPVFKLGSIAMGLTMLTAIFGGGVDTGVIPSGFHSLLAITAVVANFLALRAIVDALAASSKIVDEVNRDLGV
ncbi:MAG: hypothetical protein O3A25_13605 [Acidobacteria bacterium]|nr:hypothetical protein [Acidobacteriota bacterium]